MENDQAFRDNVLVQLERLTNAIEVLAEQQQRIQVAIFGNGKIEGSLIWEHSLSKRALTELQEDLCSLSKRFDAEIAAVKKDLADKSGDVGDLEKGAADTTTFINNLKGLNAFVGWLKSGRWPKILFFGGAALAFYGLFLVALSVSPLDLLTWVGNILKATFGA